MVRALSIAIGHWTVTLLDDSNLVLHAADNDRIGAGGRGIRVRGARESTFRCVDRHRVGAHVRVLPCRTRTCSWWTMIRGRPDDRPKRADMLGGNGTPVLVWLHSSAEEAAETE